jgi:hypothetical protein
LIDKIKKSEEIYLSQLGERFSSFDVGQSLETEFNEIQELFRNPNLLVQSILDMQQKQDESLNKIQSKLNEMNQVKEFCEETNTFQPNSISLNQIETSSLFGSIELGLFSNINSLKSEIVTDSKHCAELIKLCEFSQVTN